MEPIVVDGLTFAVRDLGRGPPVVLLHSGGMSGAQWQRLAADLSARHRVLVPDFLGCGDSTPWPPGRPFHWSADLGALHALLDRLPAPVQLVGHSYGGFLALKLARERPADVRALSLFEPVAFGVLHEAGETAALEELARAGRDWKEGPLGAGELLLWLRSFIDYWNGAGAFDALRPRVREGFLRVVEKLHGEVMSLGADRLPASAYAGLTMPVLLLSGALSTLAARRVCARLALALPSAVHEELAGVTHLGPIVEPRVNVRLLAHVAAT